VSSADLSGAWDVDAAALVRDGSGSEPLEGLRQVDLRVRYGALSGTAFDQPGTVHDVGAPQWSIQLIFDQQLNRRQLSPGGPNSIIRFTGTKQPGDPPCTIEVELALHTERPCTVRHIHCLACDISGAPTSV